MNFLDFDLFFYFSFTGWILQNESCTDHTWFQHVSTITTSSHHTFGELRTYGGGGYIIDLNVTSSDVSSVLKKMTSYQWLDFRTRFISIETTVTNPGSRLFSMINFKWEISSEGAILPTHRVTSFRLYPYVDALDYVVLVVQLIFILATIVQILMFISSIVYIRRPHGSHILVHICDAVSVVLSITAIAVYIYRIDRTIYTIERVFTNKGNIPVNGFNTLTIIKNNS